MPFSTIAMKLRLVMPKTKKKKKQKKIRKIYSPTSFS